jgi:hypothetical protein
MTRRRLLLALGALGIALFVLVAVPTAGALYDWRRERAAEAMFERIQVGMTEGDVEAIMGEPGVVTSQYSSEADAPQFGFPQHEVQKEWQPSRRAHIWVAFGGSQTRPLTVFDKDKSLTEPPSLMDRLKSLFRLRIP